MIAEVRERPRSLFLPLFLLAAAWTLWAVFQMFMLMQEGKTLKGLVASQEPTVQQAQKVRGQLDSIAAKTQVLANGGNPGAKLIVDELRKRGITINPNAKPAAEAKTAK